MATALSQVVGVLGGGQLGRMLVQAASRLDVSVAILDADERAPAKQVAHHTRHRAAPFTDAAAVRAFADTVDVLTVEIEHVDVGALREIEAAGRVPVRPSAGVIAVIQDKYRQHVHLRDAGVAVAPFAEVPAGDAAAMAASLRQHAATYGLPLMVKAKTLAYDGRGNFVLHHLDDIPRALDALGASEAPVVGSTQDAAGHAGSSVQSQHDSVQAAPSQLYVEQMVTFEREIAVMIIRGIDGSVVSYPAVETVQRDNICHTVVAPLRNSDGLDEAAAERANSGARRLAAQAVAALGPGAVGAFGVEMFLMRDGSLLLNEIAPRPHNSGHYTIEACATSQFENHLRAILGLPLGSTRLLVPCAGMLNILGTSDSWRDLDALKMAALSTEAASLHLYGKAASRRGRKLGHVTILADSFPVLDRRLRALASSTDAGRADAPNTTLVAAQAPASGDHAAASASPRVGIIMGSDSDLRVMRAAADVLAEMGVACEIDIVSAHRTPELMVRYASEAAGRGLKVIIAGAGGAAHLPGMVAALTTLPVIGVPVNATCLGGVDSLHSIVQMPHGVPVATVAIDNATNAGLLAARILGIHDGALAKALQSYAADMARTVEGKRLRLASERRDVRAAA